MPYVIQTRDKPDRAHLRAEVRAEHLEFLDANKDKLLAGGAIINDDGTGGHGGVIIVDTDDREEAEKFIADDPFTKAGLFESVTVTRWRKAFFNFEKHT
ncbi:MAG: YciI family protein [Gammaproteobacteria bacterium]|nr:YciI family protein [Gammaproteobacteria bacterium]